MATHCTVLTARHCAVQLAVKDQPVRVAKCCQLGLYFGLNIAHGVQHIFVARP